MIVVGIDPTSGARSALGFAVIDTELQKILIAKEFSIAKTIDLRTRIKEIAAALVQEFKKLEAKGEDYHIFIESTVMMGKGGESLQRTIGAIMATSPAKRRFDHVSNMHVKVFVAGHGRGDKKEIAEGLKKFFPKDQLLLDLIASSRYDALDAIAIALTGVEIHVKKSKVVRDPKFSKTK